MTFHLDSKDYMEYIRLVSKKIVDSKDYVTEIDAATGTILEMDADRND